METLDAENVVVEIDGERIDAAACQLSAAWADALERFDATEEEDRRFLAGGTIFSGTLEIEDPDGLIEAIRNTLRGYPMDDHRSRFWCSCGVEEDGDELREVRDEACICCNARARSLARARFAAELMRSALFDADTSPLASATALETLKSMGMT